MVAQVSSVASFFQTRILFFSPSLGIYHSPLFQIGSKVGLRFCLQNATALSMPSIFWSCVGAGVHSFCCASYSAFRNLEKWDTLKTCGWVNSLLECGGSHTQPMVPLTWGIQGTPNSHAGERALLMIRIVSGSTTADISQGITAGRGAECHSLCGTWNNVSFPLSPH